MKQNTFIYNSKNADGIIIINKSKYNCNDVTL